MKIIMPQNLLATYLFKEYWEGTTMPMILTLQEANTPRTLCRTSCRTLRNLMEKSKKSPSANQKKSGILKRSNASPR